VWLSEDLDAPGWRRADELYDPGGGKEADWLWLRTRLPAVDLPHPGLSIPTVLEAFEVYVGQRRVYARGKLEPDANPYAAAFIHLVSLPRAFQGRVLTLRIYSAQGAIGVLSFDEGVQLGTEPDLLVGWIRMSLDQLVVGAISIFIGLLSLLAFSRYSGRRVWLALSLGFFCILIGAFYVTQTHIAPFALGSAAAVFYFRAVPLVLFPIALYLFVARVTGHGRLIRACWIVHTAYAAIVIPADALGLVRLAELAGATQSLLGVTLVVAIGVAARAALRGNVEARTLMIGLIVAATAGVNDILRGLGKPSLPFWCAHYGQLFFIAVLAFIVNRRFTESRRLLEAYSRELEDKSEELEEYARTLEDKVSARTRDLDAKNRELESAMAELRDTQDQLVMREKMASLGDLVAGVAHEVNNPIGAVHSAADASRRGIEILSRHFDEHPSDGGRVQKAMTALVENNEVVVRASDRVAEIVRSLKNFSRLDEAEFQKADLHEGLDSTLTLLQHELKGRVEVVREYGDLPRIRCYPNQLNQVFMNILVNAAQAIDGEGTVTIRTHREGDDVVVAVSDTGRGIPERNQARIFDPGYTTKGVGVGTGLGLSISYRIIERHRGSIGVKSEPGKGTTFTIRLPINPRT
jgi:signal transduction histidine kinase